MKIIDNIKNKYEINIDNDSIHIVNYIKIIDIDYFNILIELHNKSINIIGEKLIIKKLDEKELLISGIIKGLEFVEK